MNQYPVLFISFKDVDGLDFESAYSQLLSVLSDYCKAAVHQLDGEIRTENTNSAKIAFDADAFFIIFQKPVVRLDTEFPKADDLHFRKTRQNIRRQIQKIRRPCQNPFRSVHAIPPVMDSYAPKEKICTTPHRFLSR